MNELLHWTELHHPNIFPFYGMYVFQTITLKVPMVV